MSTAPVLGGFDFLLEVSGNAVSRVIGAYHLNEVVRHHYIRAHQGKQVDIIVNSPSIVLQDSTQSGLLAVAKSTVYYHSRVLDDPLDNGSSATLEVNLIAKSSFSSSQPLSANAEVFTLDWLDTTIGEISIIDSPANLGDEAVQTILEFIQDEGAPRQYALPDLGSTSQPIGSLGVKFDQGNLLLALNRGNGVVKGDPNTLQSGSIDYDWALCFDGNVFLSDLRNSLQTRFSGSLPPPLGSGRPRISHTCTVSAFGYCANWQGVFLEMLDISLSSDAIGISGRVKVENSGALIPDATASFTASAHFVVSGSDSVDVSVDSVEVDLEDLFTSTVNFISGNYLTEKLETALLDVLWSPSTGSPLDSQVLSQVTDLASLGTSKNIEASLRLATIDIHPSSVIINGFLDLVSDNNPIADIRLIKKSASNYILDASASWAPGSAISKYLWEVNSQVVLPPTGDPGLRIEVDLSAFQAGVPQIFYPIRLQITDVQGRIAEASDRIDRLFLPPDLEWIPFPPDIFPPDIFDELPEGPLGLPEGIGVTPWAIDILDDRQLIVIGLVNSTGFLVNTSVKVVVGDEERELRTDRLGRLYLEILPEHLSTPSQNVPFVRRELSLRVEMDELTTNTVVVREIDFKERNEFISRALSRLNELENRIDRLNRMRLPEDARRFLQRPMTSYALIAESAVAHTRTLRAALNNVILGISIGGLDRSTLENQFFKTFEQIEVAIESIEGSLSRGGLALTMDEIDSKKVTRPC